MADLTDGQLDALIRHAQNAHLHGADYDAIPLLVGEVRRLRDGIREHRRLMTESYMLPPRQWERDTRQYDLNLWDHVGEETR